MGNQTSKYEEKGTHDTLMNWLQKTSQSKPMALPFALPEKYDRGVGVIDDYMTQETADMEKNRLSPEYLGSGYNGVAVVSQDKAVKYTQEEIEARIAQHSIGKSIPCLPEFYEVKELQPGMWAITMEKVKLIHDSEAAWIIDEHLRYEIHIEGDFRKMVNEWKLRRPGFSKLFEDYFNMVQCLKNQGFNPHDVHSDNIGYDKRGNLVLFDLGMSSSGE